MSFFRWQDPSLVKASGAGLGRIGGAEFDVVIRGDSVDSFGVSFDLYLAIGRVSLDQGHGIFVRVNGMVYLLCPTRTQDGIDLRFADLCRGYRRGGIRRYYELGDVCCLFHRAVATGYRAGD